MNSLIEILNVRGGQFVCFAWPMLWQSSLLIVLLFALDIALRKRVRATVRYVLWMLLLVKLVLPASLSLPTSVGYWVPAPESVVMEEAMAAPVLAGLQNSRALTIASPVPHPAPVISRTIPRPALAWPGLVAAWWFCGATVLTLVFLLRARQARRITARAAAMDGFSELLSDCSRKMGVRPGVSLRLSDAVDTPAVCGLFHPVVLLPKALAGKLDAAQMRAVLLHELAHVRRGDLWVGLMQTALQILYFYNPLLWLANAAIRRAREEAVDEMVLVAMADEAAAYPETLLNVAKFSLQAPRLAFGFAGILEGKSTLGARIRLMLQRPWPTSAKVGIPGAAALVILGLVLLPMGNARKMPSYQGKTAQQWWDQMKNKFDQGDERFQEGVNAFVHLGELGVPFLRKQLAQGKMAEIMGPGGHKRSTPGIRAQSEAAWILKEMGPAAASAVSDLIAVVKQDNLSAGYAATALGGIGAKARTAVPTLFDALRAGNATAGEALVQIDPDNPKLLPALIGALEKYSGPRIPGQPSSDHSQLIIRTETVLSKLGPRAAAAVPVLREMLKNTNGPFENDYRYCAAQALKTTAANRPDILAEADAVLQQVLPVGDISELIIAVEKARGTDGYLDAFVKLSVAIRKSAILGTPVPHTVLKERVLPLFSEALDSANQQLVDFAIGGFVDLGTVAAPLLPKVIKIAENDDPSRWLFPNEINAMITIAPGNPATLPVLLRLLNDTNTSVGRNICVAFTYFGPEAAAAVPGLHKFLDDSQIWVRFSATLALWHIAREPPSIAILKAALTKNEGDYAPLRVLEMLGGLSAQTDETKSIIRQLARSSTAEVRTNALALLEKIGETKSAR